MSVALVEKDKVGGTCLHYGCIPTKALLHAAEIADAARESSQFGISVSLDGIDMPGVNAYKDGVVSRLYKGLQGLVKARGVTLVQGEGRLVAPNAVDVAGTRYEGRHIVAATGSYAKSLPGLDIDRERVITSNEALTMEQVPGSVVVLGGGVIGVEFASVWRPLRCRGHDHRGVAEAGARRRRGLLQGGERAFRKRGIAFRTNTPFKSVDRTDGGVRVTVESGPSIEADLLLVAVGRGAVTEGLGYDEVGVTLDRGFVPTDERLRTNVAGVYAIGDLVPGLQLAHRGFAHGIFLAEDFAGLTLFRSRTTAYHA